MTSLRTSSPPELAIDVEVPTGQQVDIEVNADPGNYDIVFTQGDATSSWTFTFESETAASAWGMAIPR